MKKWRIKTFTDYRGTKPMQRVIIEDGNHTIAAVDATNTMSAFEVAELIVNAVNWNREMLDVLEEVMSDCPDVTTMTYEKVASIIAKNKNLTL